MGVAVVDQTTRAIPEKAEGRPVKYLVNLSSSDILSYKISALCKIEKLIECNLIFFQN